MIIKWDLPVGFNRMKALSTGISIRGGPVGDDNLIGFTSRFQPNEISLDGDFNPRRACG